jgi:hypothetical protein
MLLNFKIMSFLKEFQAIELSCLLGDSHLKNKNSYFGTDFGDE